MKKNRELNEKDKFRKGEKRKREEIPEKRGKKTEKRRNVGPATLSPDREQNKNVTKKDFEQFGKMMLEMQIGCILGRFLWITEDDSLL